MRRALPLAFAALLALAPLLPGTAADDTGSAEATIFDTGNLTFNQSGSWIADKVGTFVYHCHVHPSMTGTLVVTNGTAGMAAAVRIEGFRFQPENLTVPLGTNVTWVNLDTAPHTATAATHEARLGVAHGDPGSHPTSNGHGGSNGTVNHSQDDGANLGHGPGPTHADTPAPGAVAVLALVAALALLRRRAR